MTQQELETRYTFDIKSDRIGGGAFGNVYKAYDHVLDREVAIKVSQVKYIDGKEFSLISEVGATQELPDHKHIANYETVHQVSSHAGLVDYAIMQYYPEGNLKQLLGKNILSEQQKIDLAVGLLKGIAFLHDHKVLHRDLKPSNILVSKYAGRYTSKIADFGLSKLVDSEEYSTITNSFGGGTLEYSSPEQLMGNKLKYNTDLWAVGIILYEVFTGVRPFTPTDGGGSAQTKRRKTYQNIVDAPVPETVNTIIDPFDTIIKKCLVKDPQKRVQTAHALLNLLHNEEPIVDEETVIFTSSPQPPIHIEPAIEETQITQSISLLAAQQAKQEAEKELLEKQQAEEQARLLAIAQAEEEAKLAAEKAKLDAAAHKQAEDKKRLEKQEAAQKKEAERQARQAAEAQQKQEVAAKQKAKQEAKRKQEAERLAEKKRKADEQARLKAEQKKQAQEERQAKAAAKQKAKEEAARQKLADKKKAQAEKNRKRLASTKAQADKKERSWKRYLLLLLLIPIGAGIVYLKNNLKVNDTKIEKVIPEEETPLVKTELTTEMIKESDLAQLQSFLVSYPESPLQADVQLKIESLQSNNRQEAYTALLKDPSLPSLEEFIETYNGTPEAAAAQSKLNELLADQKYENESDAYRQAKESGSIALLERFLADFPTSTHKDEVLALIQQKRTQIEDQIWLETKQDNAIIKYQDYISRFPAGKYITDAEKAISRLQEDQDIAKQQHENIEESEWLAAQNIKTIESILKYNSNYPNGKYAEPAKKILRDLYEKRDWNLIDSKPSKIKIEEFIKFYPNSKYIELAKIKLIEIENSEWLAASNINTIEAYETYIKNYPDGIYHKKAQLKIKDRKNKTVVSTLSIKEDINEIIKNSNSDLDKSNENIELILKKITSLDSEKIEYFMKSETGEVIKIHKPIKQYVTEGVLLKSILVNKIEKLNDTLTIVFTDKMISSE